MMTLRPPVAVEREVPEVWDVLDEVIEGHPVLLNRAPTLHRLGIQAFDPILVEGKAIRIHPLVCAAFNADFDGDQMAVHVPLSVEAQMEAKVLMMSTNNILSPASGSPLAVPSQDIILGCYYMTKPRSGARGENRVFGSADEVRVAYDQEEVGLQARIRVRLDGKLHLTTTGRVLIYEMLPAEMPFEGVNRVMDKKALTILVAQTYKRMGKDVTVRFLDELKDAGFGYATMAGISIGMDDMHVPEAKMDLVLRAQQEVTKVEREYRDGLITDGERYNKVIDIWAHVTENVSDEMFRVMQSEDEWMMTGLGAVGSAPANDRKGRFNPIFIMADSGARGSTQQIRQLAGMRGLMAKPSGEIIETPITANFREGLTVLQYFISTHGARKGLADTALKTANSGYLTRRLVDVAQDVIIIEDDCGTPNGIEITSLVESGEVIQTLGDRILGRIALQGIRDPIKGGILVKAGEEIDESAVERIENAGIEKVRIRSVLTCASRRGVCARCYGRDLAAGRLVELGLAVGVIAAQSIGEPGTQLTMRTFHIGGTASRVSEQSTLESKHAGTVKFQGIQVVKKKDGSLIVMNRTGSLIVHRNGVASIYVMAIRHCPFP